MRRQRPAWPRRTTALCCERGSAAWPWHCDPHRVTWHWHWDGNGNGNWEGQPSLHALHRETDGLSARGAGVELALHSTKPSWLSGIQTLDVSSCPPPPSGSSSSTTSSSSKQGGRGLGYATGSKWVALLTLHSSPCQATTKPTCWSAGVLGCWGAGLLCWVGLLSWPQAG